MSRKNYTLLSAIMLGAFLALMIIIIVNDGKPFWIDNFIQKIMLDIRCEGLTFVCKSITFFSDPLFVIALIVILLIVPKTRMKIGLPVAGTELIALGIYSVLKVLVARPRPDVALWLVTETGGSFPSGHTITSFVVYGLLIYLIDEYMQNRKLAKILEIIMFALMVTIPLTRIYLCVHWPTDILGGWLFGAWFMLLCIIISDAVENRKKDYPSIEDKKE